MLGDGDDPTVDDHKRPATFQDLGRGITAMFGGQDALDARDQSLTWDRELAALDHQLEVERVQARLGEVRARAAHRAIIRAAGESEARARAAQQVAFAVALPFLLMAATAVLVLMAAWIGAAG